MPEAKLTLGDRLLQIVFAPFLVIAGMRARRRLGHWLQAREVAPANPQSGHLRLCFIPTWYGEDLGSGAESECYRLVQSLRDSADVEVATTTLKSFSDAWNIPFHPTGTSEVNGVRIHRFDPERRGRFFFRIVNRLMLMRSRSRARLGRLGEVFYLDQMIWSRGLLEFLERERENFDYFFYIPYLLSSTILGINQTGRRSVLIPCLHDEPYAHLGVVTSAFQRAGLVLFHAGAERVLAEKLYGISTRPEHVVGEQVSLLRGDAGRFRKTYKIEGPFLLYVGRKLPGKRLPELVACFTHLRKSAHLKLKLVIVGSGDLSYSGVDGVVDLGFVPEQAKVDAMAAALALCQPSLLESFSLVLMEAWVQGTPALVAAGSDVTEEHVRKSGGAVLYASEEEFTQGVERLLEPETRDEMGRLGMNYVEKNFSSEQILENFRRVFRISPAR